MLFYKPVGIHLQELRHSGFGRECRSDFLSEVFLAVDEEDGLDIGNGIGQELEGVLP